MKSVFFLTCGLLLCLQLTVVAQYGPNPSAPIDTTNLKWSGSIKNGQRSGIWYATGRKNDTVVIAEYKKGKVNGVWKEYYGRKMLRETGNYKNGQKIGLWLGYYANGDSMSASNYSNGLLDGKYYDYYLPKQIRSRGQFRKGRKEGRWEIHEYKRTAYSDAEYTICTFRSDTIEGKCMKYKNQKLYEEKNYSRGRLNGMYVMYWPDGKTCKQMFYVDDVAEGLYLGYWQGKTVQVSDSGRFGKGKKVGHWAYYELNGARKRQEWYRIPLVDTVYSNKPPINGVRIISGVRVVERMDSAYDYDYNGMVSKKTIYRDTTAQVWYLGGVREITTYYDGTIIPECKHTEIMYDVSGAITCYYRNGVIQAVTNMISSRCNGMCDWYYPNGVKRAHDVVVFGQLTDKLQLYDRNARMIPKESANYNLMRDSMYIISSGLVPDNEEVHVTQDGDDEDYPEAITPIMNDVVEVENSEDEPLSFAEEMPFFRNGGENAFQEYLKANLRYPTTPADTGVTGIVYVYFEVAKDGSIGNVKCQKGIKGHDAFDKEAVRVIRAMPPWNPGKMNGRAVKVGMTVPVRFEKT